jgi:hypothetical protein
MPAVEVTPVKHGREIKPTMRDSGTAVVDLRIEMFPSGLVHINGAIHHDDVQALERLVMVYRQAREAQKRATAKAA